MNWLDLGWLRRGDEWEFHPWGPLSRGYRISESQLEAARGRIRRVRMGVLAWALVVVSLRYGLDSWGLPLMLLVAGAVTEGALTWRVIRHCPRTERCLGWGPGLLYLVQWLRPKVLTLARILVVLLLGFSFWLIWREPFSSEPYLVAGFFLFVLLLLFYLEQVQGRRGGGR